MFSGVKLKSLLYNVQYRLAVVVLNIKTCGMCNNGIIWQANGLLQYKTMLVLGSATILPFNLIIFHDITVGKYFCLGNLFSLP